jgi:hypothetical protein
MVGNKGRSGSWKQKTVLWEHSPGNEQFIILFSILASLHSRSRVLEGRLEWMLMGGVRESRALLMISTKTDTSGSQHHT